MTRNLQKFILWITVAAKTDKGDIFSVYGQICIIVYNGKVTTQTLRYYRTTALSRAQRLRIRTNRAIALVDFFFFFYFENYLGSGYEV